jgi:hypothetical protein
MRTVWLLAGFVSLASVAPALGQQTLVSGFADQSWMVNPGSRGSGPIDHGTLAGLSILWVPGARAGLELRGSGIDLRPRDLGPGPFYQGRIVGGFGVLGTYFLRGFTASRPSGLRPYISMGGGILRVEQRYTTRFPQHPQVVSREFAYPIEVGAGTLVFVAPRLAIRTDIRFHPGEEGILRLLVGAGYMLGRPQRTPASARAADRIAGSSRATPPPIIEVTTGYTPFFDDGGALPHVAVGSGARWYVTPGVAVGPEVHYMRGEGRDRDLLTTLTATFDLGDDRDGSGAPRVTPYLVANGGVAQHWGRFQPRGSTSGLVVSFGGGVRIPLSGRFFIAPEYRIGIEPQMRFTVALGWRPGR